MIRHFRILLVATALVLAQMAGAMGGMAMPEAAPMNGGLSAVQGGEMGCSGCEDGTAGHPAGAAAEACPGCLPGCLVACGTLASPVSALSGRWTLPMPAFARPPEDRLPGAVSLAPPGRPPSVA